MFRNVLSRYFDISFYVSPIRRLWICLCVRHNTCRINVNLWRTHRHNHSRPMHEIKWNIANHLDDSFLKTLICFTYRTVMIMSVRRSHCKMSNTCQLVTDTQTYSQPSHGWYIKTNIRVSRHNISEHIAKNRNTLSVKLWMWASFPWKTLWNTLLRAVGFCAFRQTSNIWPPCSIADKMKTICSIFKWISDSENSDFSYSVSCITCSYCLIWTASIYIYICVVFFVPNCISL